MSGNTYYGASGNGGNPTQPQYGQGGQYINQMQQNMYPGMQGQQLGYAAQGMQVQQQQQMYQQQMVAQQQAAVAQQQLHYRQLQMQQQQQYMQQQQYAQQLQAQQAAAAQPQQQAQYMQQQLQQQQYGQQQYSQQYAQGQYTQQQYPPHQPPAAPANPAAAPAPSTAAPPFPLHTAGQPWQHSSMPAAPLEPAQPPGQHPAQPPEPTMPHEEPPPLPPEPAYEPPPLPPGSAPQPAEPPAGPEETQQQAQQAVGVAPAGMPPAAHAQQQLGLAPGQAQQHSLAAATQAPGAYNGSAYGAAYGVPGASAAAGYYSNPYAAYPQYHPQQPYPLHQPAHPAAPLPAAQEPVKLQKTDISTLLLPPGRASRPKRLLLVLRGLPGSGKSWLARKVREVEVAQGGQPPRVLSLDDYFMTDVEHEVVEEEGPRRGRKKTVVSSEYCYEPEMEGAYLASMRKTLAKVLAEGRSSMVLVDAPHERAADVKEVWTQGQQHGYEVYVAHAPEADPVKCHERNIHKRSLQDIQQAAAAWQPLPPLYTQLDVKALTKPEPAEPIAEVSMDPGHQAQAAGAGSGSGSKPEAAAGRTSPSIPAAAAAAAAAGTASTSGRASPEESPEHPAQQGSAPAASRWADSDSDEDEAAGSKGSKGSSWSGTLGKRSRAVSGLSDEDILSSVDKALGKAARPLSAPAVAREGGGAAGAATARGAGSSKSAVKSALVTGARSMERRALRVVWADEERPSEGFHIPASRQLEEVFVVAGLGPPPELYHESEDELPEQGPVMGPQLPHHMTFQEQVRAEHKSELRSLSARQWLDYEDAGDDD